MGGGTQEYPEKPPDLPQATDKTFSHKMQSGVLILVASWPSTPKIWWPNSNFSGQSKKNW
jgi:hypothetical protein